MTYSYFGHIDFLITFLEWINSHYPVHVKWNISQSHVTFLDGQLCTSIHIKPTNHQQYLHYHSCLPITTKHSIPYSLAIQGRRIYSHPIDLHTYTCNLTKAFASGILSP